MGNLRLDNFLVIINIIFLLIVNALVHWIHLISNNIVILSFNCHEFMVVFKITANAFLWY